MKSQYSPPAIDGALNFWAELMTGEGSEGTVVLLRLEIHPLPFDNELLDKLVLAMNSAALGVLKQAGIVSEADQGITVIDGENPTLQ